MARVLKPGGRAVILEITQPTRPPLSAFYSLWFDRIVPLLGCFSDDPEAYSYLPESVRSFPSPSRPGGEDGRAPASSGSATPCSPAGSSRSTAASAGDPPLGRAAAGDGGPGRVEPLAAGPSGRGRGSGCGRRSPATASRSTATPRRPWRRAASDCGRCWSCSARVRGRRGSGPRGYRDRAGPHGDARPRRRARRGAAAPRPPDRRRHLRPRARRRRPATCSSRAPSRCSPTPATGARSSCWPRPRWRWPAASSPSATTPSTSRSPSSATSTAAGLKTATLFECACLLGHDDERLRDFGAEIGLAFQLLDDVLDVAGPPERTGKARGTDLLDGTVTLPLIEARRRSRDARGRSARSRPGRGGGALRPHRRHAALWRRSAPAPWRWSRRRRAARCRQLRTRTAAAARLVADGVVQRYS